MIKNGIFWLTPNKLLTPFVMPIFSQTGEVKIQSARELDFELPTAALRFRKYFLHEQKRIGVLTTSQLIAEFEGNIVREQFNEVVQELDDLLLLTSLATRHRCVCRGWNSYTDSSETQFYRNRLAVPKPRKISPQETLINDPDFKDFLQHAFPTFRRNAGREALRQVVDLLVTSHEGTLESGFIKCFAALETLVAVYRHRAGLDQILNSELWMTFEKDLKSFIKNHPLFREDAARRKLVYEKTSELNRVAFGTVYKQCSSDLGGYGFHDDDLWPVVGPASGVSLSEIRNRLVHGVVFTPSQQEALFKALIHLRWCVERMVLAALEWPLERSLVGEFLRHMAPYNSWREEQRTLTEQRAQPDGGLSPDAPDEVKL